MSDNREQKRIVDDKGFTLVELVIVVAILALASVVLIKSFSVAAVTNGKAQRIQNATSLAESVMEEIKSSGIKQLQKKYNGGETTEVAITSKSDEQFAALTSRDKFTTAQSAASTAGKSLPIFLKGGTAKTPYYVLVKTGVTATSGEVYDVTATLRTSTYSAVPADESTPITNASNANSIKLPVIEEIDTHTKTVLTNKEINKYDVAAVDYFREHDVDEARFTIKSKDIAIDKEGSGAAAETSEIKVKCTVTYTAQDSSGNTAKYSKEVFKGTYLSKKDKSGNYMKVDNDIYIFYNRGISSGETITVNDSSTDDSHRVYLICQNDADGSELKDISGTTVDIYKAGTRVIHVTANSAIKYDDDMDSSTPEVFGRVTASDCWLITNLGKDSATEGSMLENKSKNRIFDITVDVTRAEDGQSYANITSTDAVRE